MNVSVNKVCKFRQQFIMTSFFLLFFFFVLSESKAAEKEVGGLGAGNLGIFCSDAKMERTISGAINKAGGPTRLSLSHN